ncbi:MAG: PD-(D/E)XK nuclease family protein [Fidelibacterota bacterium]
MQSGPHVGNRNQTLEEIPRLVESLVERGYNYGDVAVLCRTWNQARTVAGALERTFVPVDIFEEHFFDNPLVKDVLAWGNLLSRSFGTGANDALFRVLSQQAGSSFAESFFRSQEESTLGERLAQLRTMIEPDSMDQERREKLSWMLETLSSLKTKLKQKRRADEMIWEILDATDLLKSTRHSYRHLERLALVNAGRLLSLAEDFVARENQSSGGLDRWLRYMDILTLRGSMPTIFSPGPRRQTDLGVQVMTIHGSKGLEFPVVMIPFLQAGSLPLSHTPSSTVDCLPESWYRWTRPKNMTPRDEQVSEERRIFFVGLTRAKNEIHLFGPEKRRSLFIKEIFERSDQCLEVKTMAETSSTISHPKASGQTVKQRILVALNRELSSGQYTYAHELIEGLRSLDQEGKLPDDFPLAFSVEDLAGLERRPEETGESSPASFPAPGEPPGLRPEVTLSASSAEEYDRCPYKYRLKEIDKVPERKSRVQMEFGIIIHRVLEEFHASGTTEWGLDHLLSLLDKHWRSEAFEYVVREEEFKRQGIQMLTDYFQFSLAHPPEVLAREARFDFTLDELNVRVAGKIDRVDREGEALSVTDYKTGRNREKAGSSLQLALYTEALKRNAVTGIEGKPGSARLHFLRFPEEPLESHLFSSKELQTHLETLEKVANGIRRGEFSPKKGWHCRFCDYRDFLCPAWEES